jgi:hypothetical protein
MALSAQEALVAEALWEWDPLCVANAQDEIPNQYDGVAQQVTRRLIRGGANEAKEYLRWYLEEDLQISVTGLDEFVTSVAGRLSTI